MAMRTGAHGLGSGYACIWVRFFRLVWIWSYILHPESFGVSVSFVALAAAGGWWLVWLTFDNIDMTSFGPIVKMIKKETTPKPTKKPQPRTAEAERNCNQHKRNVGQGTRIAKNHCPVNHCILSLILFLFR
jgi:hypothetical protein